MRLLLPLALSLFALSAQAQESPMDWLVQHTDSGALLGYSDPVPLRRHDWGGPGVPLGYVASENWLPWWVGNTAVQTWSFGPGHFTPSRGDGGQVASVAGTKAIYWATQDGGTPGMQYFVGPLCGGDGWLLFDTAHQINSQWVGQVARLSIATSPDACPPLGEAYTRWMRGLISYPFQNAGLPAGARVLDSILSEHYDHANISDSVNMERNWFTKEFGNIRWEAWSRTRPPGDNLSVRCPRVTLGGYYDPETTGWHLTDCRYYTNFVPAFNYTVAQFGWP